MDALTETATRLVAQTKTTLTHLGCMVKRARIFDTRLGRIEEHVILEGPIELGLEERKRGNETVNRTTVRNWRSA